MLFVLQGLLLLAELLTFVRIMKSYYNSVKVCLGTEDKYPVEREGRNNIARNRKVEEQAEDKEVNEQ